MENSEKFRDPSACCDGEERKLSQSRAGLAPPLQYEVIGIAEDGKYWVDEWM
jgi:hypothetical protein